MPTATKSSQVVAEKGYANAVGAWAPLSTSKVTRAMRGVRAFCAPYGGLAAAILHRSGVLCARRSIFVVMNAAAIQTVLRHFSYGMYALT